MKKESLLTSMLKLILVVSLIVGVGAVFGMLGYSLTMTESGVVVNDKIEKEDVEDEEIIIEVKYVCEQETNKNKDGCYIRNAITIASIDYNKAKIICDLTSELRKYDCDLQILAIADVNKLEAKCEDIEDRLKKEQCYNILISKISETGFNEAIKLCDTKSSAKDSCYVLVAEKISFTYSAEIYNEALTICDKLEWQELKESCKENCKWNYEYEQEYGETADWKTYRNEDLGFELIFPDRWKDYKINEGNTSVTFSLEIKDSVISDDDFEKHYSTVFFIGTYAKEEWESIQSVIGPKPTYLNENNDYIFAYSMGHDDAGFIGFSKVKPDEVYQGPYYDVKNKILPTFKFIEKDETADWQTYWNEEYGFEVKYPEDWHSYVSNPANIYLQPNEEIPGSIPGSHASALEIKTNLISRGISLTEVIKSKLKFDFKQEKINIGGADGLRVETICEGLGCGVPEWFVIEGDYLYHFNSNLGYSKIFDQILSTFKFIEK